MIRRDGASSEPYRGDTMKKLITAIRTLGTPGNSFGMQLAAGTLVRDVTSGEVGGATGATGAVTSFQFSRDGGTTWTAASTLSLVVAK
jgi:hypothetical protein